MKTIIALATHNERNNHSKCSMYNSLYSLFLHYHLLLQLIVVHIDKSESFHCRVHLRHHQPSFGHHLLRIESDIPTDQSCHHQCSMDHSCSMATYHHASHRCHLFHHHHHHSSQPILHPYRKSHAYSTFAHCSNRLFLTDLGPTRVTNMHCQYDSLPWQRVYSSRTLVFKSYTLIGVSFLPCQELCSSVRHCAAVQYRITGSKRHRCRLLRSAKPWELHPSRRWTIFVKRTCHLQIHQADHFIHYQVPRCSFTYFGENHHIHHHDQIHTFTHVSEAQCQYFCSLMVHCLGVEFVDRRSRCTLLSSNILQNDGSLDVKSHHHHHIYMKTTCEDLPSPRRVLCSPPHHSCQCSSHQCAHGTCSYHKHEGYHYMSCHCHQGYTGNSCSETIENDCPCLNGGHCLDHHEEHHHHHHHHCHCSQGYTGEFCQIVLDDQG